MASVMENPAMVGEGNTVSYITSVIYFITSDLPCYYSDVIHHLLGI